MATKSWEENIADGMKSGYFNSREVNGEKDRLYNAEDMTQYFEGLITNGVYATVGNRLEVTANSDMSVTVDTGRAMIDCRWFRNTMKQVLSLSAADSVSGRTDLIVIKLDLTVAVRQMTLEVLENTSTLPADTDEIKYLLLASAYIAPNATAPAVTDMRSSEQCGYVTTISTQAGLTKKRFTETVSASAGTRVQKSINIATSYDPEFNSSFDTLFVYKNGLMLTESEFSVSGSGTTVTINDCANGTVLDFVILRGDRT